MSLSHAWSPVLQHFDTASEVTKEQQNFALGVYNAFRCKKLQEYHYIYLRTDVFLLADIFQKLREVFMPVYKLDPAHFHSAPNLSCGAMLITTDIKLEVLQDIDQLPFFEKAVRVGCNGLGDLRPFEANSKHLENFNSIEDSTLGVFFLT